MVGVYIIGAVLNIFIIWYVFSEWIKKEKVAMGNKKIDKKDVFAVGLVLVGVIYLVVKLILDLIKF
jgi:divalent metal cation (Fe/Co/Zn/Cd) transporter